MKISKINIALILILIVSVSGIVAATYIMNAPASDTVTVTDPPAQATLSKVTVSATSLYVGDDLTLTTTVSDHTAGIEVTFKTVSDGSVVGTATTDANGLASLTIEAQAQGTYSFTATATHP